MQEKQATWLGWLTLIALLAAIWIVFGEDPNGAQAGRGEKLYAGLESAVDSLTTVTIVANDQTVTLTGSGRTWTVAERGGYQADSNKVAALVSAMVRSTRREPKTTRKSRFADLGLGSGGTLVTLTTAGDAPDIPALDVGTRNEGASGRSLTYVYKSGDTRAWLVSDLPSISAGAADWIARELTLLARDQIADVRFADVTLVRDSAGDMVVDGLTGGETMTAPLFRTAMTRLFSQLDIVDVQNVTNPLAEPELSVTATDADGVRVAMTLYSLSDVPWVQVTVSASGDVSGDADRSAALRDRTQGWLFRIADSDAAILRRTRSDFVTVPESPVDPENPVQPVKPGQSESP